MKAWLVGCALLVLASVAWAAPRKVLVLPLDGDADPAVRAKINSSIQKLARVIDGQVSAGDTTFDETASAVGCDPAAPRCADEVISTLGVQELVWGNASMQNGQLRVTIRRATKGTPPHELATTLAPQDPPERAEAGLVPLFTGNAGAEVTDPTTAGAGSADLAPPPAKREQVPPGPTEDRTRRNIGIAFAAAGGVVLLIGVALWSSASGSQNQIDNHRADTARDFAELQDLESKTLKYAVFGDLMVLGGLALGGYGAWILYEDHKERQSVVVSPAPIDHGAAVMLRGVW